MTPKVAMITGTSTGLGISIATQLAAKQYKVYATMRNLDKQGDLQEAARQAGVDIHVLRLDVQDPASIQQCVDRIIDDNGQIDLLVNNAGAGLVGTTEHTSDEDIEWVLDVNLKGVIRCTRAVLPHMRRKQGGRIINITSVGGLVGQPFNEIYCAAKFAVEGYTEAMASYVGPAFNIHFSCVEPGGIHSEFANNVLAHFQKSGGMNDEGYKPILDAYLGGAGDNRADGIYQSADEVAETVVDCAFSDTPPLRVRTSDWANQFCQLKTQADPTGLKLVERVRRELL